MAKQVIGLYQPNLLVCPLLAVSHPLCSTIQGLLESIVSDRDATFKCAFWHELLCLSDTKLSFSSNYHSQSEGQIEVMHRTTEMYLCSFASDWPKTLARLHC